MHRVLRLASLFLASAPLLLAAACSDTVVADDMVEPDSGSGADATTNGDAAPQDGGPTADAGVLYQNDDTVKITEKGGFTAGAPDGSTCQPADDTFIYVLATKSFSWKLCKSTDGGLYAYDTGSRVLSSTEAATLQSALDAVTIHATQDGCGADKPALMMEITSPSALTPTDYYDQFYHCNEDGKTYVDGLDEVVSAASTLAHG